VPALLLSGLFALLIPVAGCGRQPTRATPALDSPFRFIDHLDEARVEGNFAQEEVGEAEVYANALEIGGAGGAGDGARPAGLVPFAGFEPPPEADGAARAPDAAAPATGSSPNAAARSAWRAARRETAAAIARGPDERVADSRGLLIARLSSGEFTGLRTPPIPVRPGATYRAEVWVRTDGLELPSPETGAALLAFGLALGATARADADAHLDELGYFSNHAVALDEIVPGSAYVGTTGWTHESITVKSEERVDHVILTLAAHGPQAPGRRSGSVRFDDLRLYEVQPPLTALPPVADHFTGALHALKKRVRITETGAGGDEVTWNAILAPAPGRVSFEAAIPRGARLAFAYATPPRAWGAGGGVTFAIDIEAGGRTARVFEATARPGAEPADRAWRRGSADLSAFGGHSATIRFVTEREEGGGATAGFWGEPVMCAAPPPAAGAAGAAGAPAMPSRAPRSVLLISIDTLRPDRLGCYGSPRRVSPAIDRLAADGSLFETCISASSWTLPAHASMLTGVSPSVHRVTADARRLGDSRHTLAELLRREGLATGAFVTHYYLSGDYGLDRGFESFAFHQDLRASETCDRAASWLGANADRPFFLFLHLFDPHWDYRPPAPYAEVVGGAAARNYKGPVDGSLEAMQPWIEPRAAVPPADLAHAIDLYDGEIAVVDAALGRLFAALDSLGLAERTLVIVTSDHGEEFRDHDSFGHGHTLYQETVRVPLVVRAPGGAAIARGAIRSEIAATVDIAPTILAWATGGGAGGGEADSTDAQWVPEGHDLLGAGAGADAGARAARSAPRTILSETERFGSWRLALTRDSLKYLTAGQFLWWRRFEHGPQMFDLAGDPGEARNLLAAKGEVAAGAPIDLPDAATQLYLARHRGIFLVCRGGADRSHAVRVRVSGATLAAPTGIGLEPADRIAAAPDGADISLELTAGDRDIVLLRSDHPEAVRVTAAWDGAPPPTGLIVLGPARRVASLPIDVPIAPARLAPSDPASVLAWEGPGLWVLASSEEAGTDFTLDDEEIARLRALGYIR